MRTKIVLTLAAAAALTASVAAAPVASAAPAKAKGKPSAVVVTSSAPVALLGTVVSYTAALHLPAGTDVVSWKATFGDHTKADTGTGAPPHVVRHTFHKTLKGSMALVVTAADGTTYSGTTPVIVTALEGKVTEGQTPLRGLWVSFLDPGTDDSDESYLTHTRTDAKGFWYAPPNLRKPKSSHGYDILVNVDAGANDDIAGQNLRFNILERDHVKPGSPLVHTQFHPMATVTGKVLNSDGSPAAGATVIAFTQVAGRDVMAAGAQTDGNGMYRIGLGNGYIWQLGALGGGSTLATAEVSPTPVPVNVQGTADQAAPDIQMQTLDQLLSSSPGSGGLTVTPSFAGHLTGHLAGHLAERLARLR
jgi:hypothetical protein